MQPPSPLVQNSAARFLHDWLRRLGLNSVLLQEGSKNFSQLVTQPLVRDIVVTHGLLFQLLVKLVNNVRRERLQRRDHGGNVTLLVLQLNHNGSESGDSRALEPTFWSWETPRDHLRQTIKRRIRKQRGVEEWVSGVQVVSQIILVENK
jgi:hypothetical protein